MKFSAYKWYALHHLTRSRPHTTNAASCLLSSAPSNVIPFDARTTATTCNISMVCQSQRVSLPSPRVMSYQALLRPPHARSPRRLPSAQPHAFDQVSWSERKCSKAGATAARAGWPFKVLRMPMPRYRHYLPSTMDG